MKIQNGVLVSYTGQEEHLIIPREVTEIAAYAFHNCDSLRSVTIPDSVKKIGPCAFHGCPAFYTSFFAFRNLKNFVTVSAADMENRPRNRAAPMETVDWETDRAGPKARSKPETALFMDIAMADIFDGFHKAPPDPCFYTVYDPFLKK